jgi:SHS2 domain-containing protein
LVPYQVLDHTADFMVEVSADDLPGLFVEAARAFFDILTDSKTIRPRKVLEVGVEAVGEEELLVSWLTEFLFLHETELWLFSRFEITAMDEGKVRGKAWGEKLDPARHPIEREVKAVTYHRLGLVRENGGIRTTIVFDL